MQVITAFLVFMGVLASLAAFGEVDRAPDTPFVQEYHEAYPLKGPQGVNDVRTVAADPLGNVYAGTGAGAYVLKKGASQWTALMSADDAGPVFDIAVDNGGGVWVGAWNGLWRLSGDALAHVDPVRDPIGAVCATASGIVCVGPDGLWRVQGGDCVREPVNCARSIRGVVEDPDGGLWIATENGLYHQTDEGLRLYQLGDDILTAATSDVAYAADGRLWVTGLGGVTVYKDAEPVATYQPKDGLPTVFVKSVALGPDGVMWVGTEQGVTRYDGERWSLRHSRRWLLSDDVRDVAFDGDGTAWIATAGGVSAIKRRTMTLAEKADYFQKICMAHHVRDPWLVESCRLPVPGDNSVWKPDDDDNDGEYTAMYLVMECYRYAATKDPDAKANAKRAFDALRFLQTVTETDGFVARTVVPSDWTHMHDPNREWTERERASGRVNSPRVKLVEKRWRPSSDGKWLWKGDTSSDEITGHMYGYLFYYDMVADEAEREAVAQHVCKIVDYIIAGGYVLKDIDGTHTQWGVWSPEKLNGDPDWAAERGINSAEILSYLKLAYHVSGDERYQKEYLSLLHDHGYAENVKRAKTFEPMWITHIDDELLALVWPVLLLHEDDPELRQLYLDSFDVWYSSIEYDRSPFFNFMYTELSGKKAHFADSMEFLREAPLDLINWTVDNTKREDLQVVRVPQLESRQTSRLVPVSERGVVRWDKNPWDAIKGDGGRSEWTPVYWLLPYWMGRYHGYIEAAE